MSTRTQVLTAEQNAQWLRAERDRRRLAFTKSRQQRRGGIETLARAGLRVVPMPSLDDVLAEVMPPCL